MNTGTCQRAWFESFFASGLHTFFAAALVGCIFLVQAAAQQDSSAEGFPCERKIAEAALRDAMATKVVKPIYPEEAIRNKTVGIVVTEVCVRPDSETAYLRIVTAPSDAIAASVTAALLQWRFRRDTNSFGSKVIYYFVHRNDRWEVLSPADRFFVGPTFSQKQGA